MPNLRLSGAVGRRCPNAAADVRSAAAALVEIGKLAPACANADEYTDPLDRATVNTQHHWMLQPDGKYESEIVASIGQAEYAAISKDLVANEDRVLELVRGTGQDIAAPGSSQHQRGKAADIGGPSPARRAEVTRMVARANPQVFIPGRVRLETNGCVHFEIR